MELEMSVEDLLNKRKLESDRIEFKAGWNPDDIYHSVCALQMIITMTAVAILLSVLKKKMVLLNGL